VNFCTEEDNVREYKSFESDAHPTPPEADYGVIFRSCLSGAQIEKINPLIQKIQPEAIVFVATMRNCDVQLPSPLLVYFCSSISNVHLTVFDMNWLATFQLSIFPVKILASSSSRELSK
jgi:hypothetical protein